MKKAIINKISTVGNFLKLLVFFALELLIIGGAITLDFPAEVKLLVSNVLSIILAFIFYRSIAKVMTEAAKGEISRNLHEESLNARIAKLESEKRDLEQKLESADQTRRFFDEIKFEEKLELLEVSSSGYIVKEEDFQSVCNNTTLAPLVPNTLRQEVREFLGKWGEKHITPKEKRSMLFIEKARHKFSIGIRLSDIHYAIDPSTGTIYLSGLELSILHDTSAELKRKQGDISHCWVVTTDSNGDSTIKNASTYNRLENAYRQMQIDSTTEMVERNTKAQCLAYTKGVQESLRQRYPNLRFVPVSERGQYSLNWQAIRFGGNDPQVTRIITDMVLGLHFLQASNKESKENSSTELLDI